MEGFHFPDGTPGTRGPSSGSAFLFFRSRASNTPIPMNTELMRNMRR